MLKNVLLVGAMVAGFGLPVLAQDASQAQPMAQTETVIVPAPPPVVYQQAPVVYQPAPAPVVYTSAPQPVVYPPATTVVYQPAPVYVPAPPPVVYEPVYVPAPPVVVYGGPIYRYPHYYRPYYAPVVVRGGFGFPMGRSGVSIGVGVRF